VPGCTGELESLEDGTGNPLPSSAASFPQHCVSLKSRQWSSGQPAQGKWQWGSATASQNRTPSRHEAESGENSENAGAAAPEVGQAQGRGQAEGGAQGQGGGQGGGQGRVPREVPGVDLSEMVEVGVILGPHGLKGDVRVKVLTDFPEQRLGQVTWQPATRNPSSH